MKHYFTVEKAPIFIKFYITLGLLLSVKDLPSINSFTELAVVLLEFIIILELIRILIVNDKFDIVKIISLLGVIAILFVFRIVTMKYSPTKMEK